MNKVENMPQVLIAIKDWDVRDFRRALANEADYWAQEGYDLARGWMTGRFEDNEEWQDACRCADQAQHDCHNVRAPFAWAGYYAPEDATTSDLYRAWLEGLNREAAYRNHPVDALAHVRKYERLIQGRAA